MKFNNTEADFSWNRCIHELFEAQVERTPEVSAVISPIINPECDEKEQLTYRELNQRANQVAHYLQELGVGPEVLVGICMERSVEMIVGLLGILKAGGAYVPLDAEYPQERLAFMLADSQVAVLLTQAHLLARLPECRAKVVCLDSEWEFIAQHSQQKPVSGVSPENLAYVIYTSGSTGQPKGVMIQHRSLVNYTEAASVEYKLGPDDHILQFASISWDTSVEEIYSCLTCGATLVLRTPSMLDSVSTFQQKCREWDLTVLNLPTAYWHELTAHLSPTEALTFSPPLRLVIIGGEKALPERLVTWQKYIGQQVRLVNTYGLTEATAVTTVGELSGAVETDTSGREVPIGRPIRNIQTYVLDQGLRLVPIGVVGELYIGGEGLARGYLNRPELTAERFIPHPFSQTPGARLYKTGDLVRYRADGNLEFGGRLDHQVKLRGYRIELGEIEAVLRQVEGVRETVVVVREDRPGDQRLVGYVVLAEEAEVKESGLRAEVGEKLPGYMVPSVIMRLEALPLTPNGKVDRLALPVPDQAVYELESAFVLPQDRLELELTKLWEQVLNIRPIGVRDNFFELGGHSLLAVRLFAHIEQVFGQKLPVATLFQAPTIEQLAGVLRQEGLSGRWSSLVAIQPGGSRPPFFCIHGMGGGILDYTNLARSLGPDQPFYGLQEWGLNGLHEPFTQIEAMAAHYTEEIRNLQPEGPYFLGGYCFGGTVAFEVARQLQVHGHQVGLLAIIDNTAPNFSYDQISWQPGTVIKFFRNLPYWLSHFLHLSPDQMLARLRRKAKQKAKNIFDPPTVEHSWVDIEEIIDDDLSQIPKEHHKLLMAHYLALINYQPQVYPGRITLFRTRRESLLGPFDSEMGWGRLATEGVEIKEISGFHAALLQQPHVQSLAKQLRRCLDEAQPAR
jgi:amino acid adenylation domain-containing protein